MKNEAMTDQEKLNADSLSRTLRVGRQMTAFTDALFAGVKPVEPVKDDAAERPGGDAGADAGHAGRGVMGDYTVSVTRYGRMLDTGKREVRHGMTPAEAFVEYVPPFRVEQYFASDSYYFEVQDSKGQRVTDYDSEKCANWLRDYMNAGGDKAHGGCEPQKWCQTCCGTGRFPDDDANLISSCPDCGGAGALP
jgi:hypothetical protein